MDINIVTQIISTVGFPIAACCYMAYANQKQTEQHKAEIDKMTEAVNDLKIAIVTLTEKINN